MQDALKWDDVELATFKFLKLKYINKEGVPKKQFSYSVKLVSLLIPGNLVPSWIWGSYRELEKSKYFQSRKIYYLENYGGNDIFSPSLSGHLKFIPNNQ